jgi:hypothetical protein
MSLDHLASRVAGPSLSRRSFCRPEPPRAAV